MNTRLGEKSTALRICGKCRAELFPRRAKPPWQSDMHRSAAKDMAVTPDPKAERIRAKKERKAEKAALRAAFRVSGPSGAARLFIQQIQPSPIPSEECPTCLAMTQRAPSTRPAAA